MHEFRLRFIFSPTPRTLVLCVVLMLVSGASTIAVASLPGASEAREAAKTVAGLSVEELLALIALGAMALCAYMSRLVVADNRKSAEQLQRIADRLAQMKCIAKEES